MTTHTWNGVDIEDLTRDELLEAYKAMIEDYARLNTPEEIQIRAMGKAARLAQKQNDRQDAERFKRLRGEFHGNHTRGKRQHERI